MTVFECSKLIALNVYSYGPNQYNSPRRCSAPVYEVIAYENEFDPNSTIDIDLEQDGQYRNRLPPSQEADNLHTKDKCSIYSRRAWFRDMPLVWWELLPSIRKDF